MKLVERSPFLLLCLLSCLHIEATAGDESRDGNLRKFYITTKDNQPVVSKTEYKYAEVMIIDGADTLSWDSVQIRGRGNSTWDMPKKPYRLKFNNKVKLIDAKKKKWVLLANCADKS